LYKKKKRCWLYSHPRKEIPDHHFRHARPNISGSMIYSGETPTLKTDKEMKNPKKFHEQRKS
jgi:hypothetical protein